MSNKAREKELPERTLSWLFFSFKGRIRRKTFALAAGFLFLPQIWFVIQLVKNEANPDLLALWFLFMVIVILVSVWSIFSLFIKRLHDLNLPGVLALLSFFSGINILFFLFLAFMPSSKETNRHGPSITS